MNSVYWVIFLVLLSVVCIGIYFLYNPQNIDKTALSLVNPGSPRIPKIIIQTWKTADVPHRYKELVDSIKKLNPDYEYKFFTDATIDSFLKTNYPEYYQTYLNLPIKIQRIDFFRYLAVYHYGGFYMDLDMAGLQSFDPLLTHDCVFPIDEIIRGQMCKMPRYKPFCDRGYNYLLGQYAFAASPRHPFIKALIDRIHTNLNKYIKHVNFNSEDYVYKTTGPDFVTEIYMDYEDSGSDVFILENGRRQYFGDFAKHNYFGTWK